jgi:hypothetical protein
MISKILEIQRTLFLSPDRDDAAALGSSLFSNDQEETVMRPFAPPVNMKDSLRYIRLFHSTKRFEVTFWLHGSRVRSTFLVNLFLQICARLSQVRSAFYQLCHAAE